MQLNPLELAMDVIKERGVRNRKLVRALEDIDTRILEAATAKCDKKMAILKDIAQQSPQNATYQYHLGMALWKEGKTTEAREPLRRALQLHLSTDQAHEAENVLAKLNKSL